LNEWRQLAGLFSPAFFMRFWGVNAGLREHKLKLVEKSDFL